MTTKQPDTRKNITVWETPNTMLQSQYGNVTYLDWCEKEVVRTRANGRQAVIVKMKGMIALARP